MKNKKGFVLTETLIVTVFLIGIWTFIYISIRPLVGQYEDKIERENDIAIVYKLYHLRKLVYRELDKESIRNMNIKRITCGDFSDASKCFNLLLNLELNNYDLIYTNSIHDNLDELQNISQELSSYLHKYQDSDEEVIFLLDKDKHTFANLKF